MLKIIINLIAVASLLFSFAALAAQININTAAAKAISEAMHGVGLSKAELIVKYRDENGFFRNIDELQKVKGIGPKTMEKNRDNIVLELPEKAASFR